MELDASPDAAAARRGVAAAPLLLAETRRTLVLALSEEGRGHGGGAPLERDDARDRERRVAVWGLFKRVLP